MGNRPRKLSPEEWEEVAYNLGQGLRNMTALYAPEVISIGGGVALGGGKQFIEAARKVMEEHLKLVPVPRVGLSQLGYDTALKGAIAMALNS